MACTCPLDFQSMSQLCADCEEDYLRYLDSREAELDNRNPEPEPENEPEPAAAPATFAAMTEWLESSEIIGELIARIIRLECETRTQRAALEIQRERINRNKEFLAAILGTEAA